MVHRRDEASDQDLLEAYLSGEDLENTYRRIFDRFRKPLLSFFSKKGLDHDLCQELSQETFLRVYRSRKNFRGDVPLASWVFQIAANLFRNELRRRGAEKRSGLEQSLDADDGDSLLAETQSESSTSPASPTSALDRLLQREQVAAVVEAIESLPPKMRRTVRLRIYKQRSISDIAELMQVTDSTVKAHLHQARHRLRDALGALFDDLPL